MVRLFNAHKPGVICLAVCSLWLTSATTAEAIPVSKQTKGSKAAQAKAAKVTGQSLRGKVLFMRDEALWVISTNGKGKQRILPKIFAKNTGNQAVAVSPDGASILYTHKPRNLDKYTGNDLFRIRPDGTGQQRLTNTGFMLFSQTPQFSPDGKSIVYSRWTGYRMGGPGYTDVELRIMNENGSNDRRLVGDLTNSNQNHYRNLWSSDGKRVLFTRTTGCLDYGKDVGYEQRVIDAKGTNEAAFKGNWRDFLCFADSEGKLQLAREDEANENSLQSVTRESNPMPDKHCKQIVFQATRLKTSKGIDNLPFTESFTEVWTVGADGKNLQRLTEPQSTLVGWVR